MINLKLLTSLNIATSDAELLADIETLARWLEDGIIAATVDRDEITALYLTKYGLALLPTATA
jgi:hypothetical protein